MTFEETRSKSNALPFANSNAALETASRLLATVYPFKRSVRLLGVTLSILKNEVVGDHREQPQLGFGL